MKKYQCFKCHDVYPKEILICPNCKGEVFLQQKIPYIERVTEITQNRHQLRSVLATKITFWASIAIMIIVAIYTALTWNVFLSEPFLTLAIVVINSLYLARAYRNLRLSFKVQEIIKEYYFKYQEKLF